MTAALTVFDCDHLADEITLLAGQANAINYRLLTLIARSINTVAGMVLAFVPAPTGWPGSVA